LSALEEKTLRQSATMKYEAFRTLVAQMEGDLRRKLEAALVPLV
jgi:hypothetical protein